MGGKRLDDDDVSTWSSQRRSAYQRGVDDTHERYAAMQAQASEWLSGVIAYIARVEQHELGTPTHELRQVIPLADLPLQCPCPEHSPVDEAEVGVFGSQDIADALGGRGPND
jgi:hypothetical protein